MSARRDADDASHSRERIAAERHAAERDELETILGFRDHGCGFIDGWDGAVDSRWESWCAVEASAGAGSSALLVGAATSGGCGPDGTPPWLNADGSAMGGQ